MAALQPFLQQSVDPSRPDGYWIEAFPFKSNANSVPDLVAYGLGTSEATSSIELYLNPYNVTNPPAINGVGWQKRQIAELHFPVACSYADISGNGLNDIVLSDEYGPSMNDIWPNGGRVSWFQNTGDRNNTNWTRRYIGRSPGMHRLKVGHFTTRSAIQIIAIPIVVKSSDLTSPAPVIIYTSPKAPGNAEPNDDTEGWPNEIAFANTFRLIHEITVLPSRDGDTLDQVLVAGREGVSLLWYDTAASEWKYENLGQGLPQTPGNPYWGSGSGMFGVLPHLGKRQPSSWFSVAVAKVGNDRYGYIASCEAFHGNHVSVYVKDSDAPTDSLVGVKWTRHVLDDFGPLNEANTGSIHYVTCVDVDGDGEEEMLVALMGSDPPSWRKTGIWCYKPIDLKKSKFARFKLSDTSAARIAIGDFVGHGVVDLATVSYSVPGYFESPNPSADLFINSSITAIKLQDQVVLRVPNPSSTFLVDEVEFLDVSSRKLALVVVPPKRKYAVNGGDGLKVIKGRVNWTGGDNVAQTRSQAIDPFTTISTIVDSKDGYIYTDTEGAIFLLMKRSTTSGTPPYSDMNQLIANNIFPEKFPGDVRNMKFPWVKVQDRPWANGKFKDLEFYNLVGFYVRSADDADELLCHIQLWTAGVSVSAGFHNHIGEIFCEIHSCIVNGTGEGGMSWATVPDAEFNPEDPDPKQYESIVVGDMHEHGPLWRTGSDGIPERRLNGTVDYPWHAWNSGAGDPEVKQSFDVWIAFEFPPLLARAVRLHAATLEPGRYRLVNPFLKQNAAVKDGDTTDGTPIIAARNPEELTQEWEISIEPGTELTTLKNSISGSFATVAWPPISGQALVGSRSLAVLGITSKWAITSDHESYRIWLIDTHLVWTLDESGKIILTKNVAHERRQLWNFKPLSR